MTTLPAKFSTPADFATSTLAEPSVANTSISPNFARVGEGALTGAAAHFADPGHRLLVACRAGALFHVVTKRDEALAQRTADIAGAHDPDLIASSPDVFAAARFSIASQISAAISAPPNLFTSRIPVGEVT